MPNNTPRQYNGSRTPSGPKITVIIYTEGGTSTAPLAHVVVHSPTGMEWGYPGSGPADTALSILADYFDETPSEVRAACRSWAAKPSYAAGLYQAFKTAFVARWQQMAFMVDSYAISAWLNEPAQASHAANIKERRDQWEEDQRYSETDHSDGLAAELSDRL